MNFFAGCDDQGDPAGDEGYQKQCAYQERNHCHTFFPLPDNAPHPNHLSHVLVPSPASKIPLLIIDAFLPACPAQTKAACFGNFSFYRKSTIF
jgi:hypothetical protein